ncbi:sigma-70 family RNA polymerase sigma factor [Paenibacillus motobuensis]|uniref:Sigma-70 family RNA polymerase sigma factor n=2 Tax=Paenibacillus motobuensis TaxID=295324 RepID=A0ABN0Y187_9BACL
MEPGQLHQILKPKMMEIQKYLIRLGATCADAEDVVQDTVYKAILYLDSIEASKFSAWMYKVAINRYYDLCRRNKRFQLFDESIEVPDLELPEDKLLQQERREDIERILSVLQPLHRQLLIMKYELDMSYLEISDALGIKVEIVKATLYRARKQFQKMYRGDVK